MMSRDTWVAMNKPQRGPARGTGRAGTGAGSGGPGAELGDTALLLTARPQFLPVSRFSLPSLLAPSLLGR